MAFFGSSWNEDEEEGGSIFGPRKGTWTLHSEQDPRWNASGRCYVGGFVMPSDCEKKLEELKKQYGEPPDDLEWGYMKD